MYTLKNNMFDLHPIKLRWKCLEIFTVTSMFGFWQVDWLCSMIKDSRVTHITHDTKHTSQFMTKQEIDSKETLINIQYKFWVKCVNANEVDV